MTADLKSKRKAFIDIKLLMDHPSNGAVIGVVSDERIPVEDAVPRSVVQEKMRQISAKHRNGGKTAWTGTLLDLFLGMISCGRNKNSGLFKHLNLDPQALIERLDLTGVTHNKTGPTRRFRFQYRMRAVDTWLVIDRIANTIHKDTAEILYSFAAANNQTKSLSAQKRRAA